jgi:hypothetical protein
MISKLELVTPCPECGCERAINQYTDNTLYVGGMGPEIICAKWQCSDCTNRWETYTEFEITGIEYGETTVKGSGDQE